MIGGPTDVVVETNIVRAAAAVSRETAPARNGAADTAPRAIPLPDPTPWPLQPEAPAPVSTPPLRATRNAADEAWRSPPETPSGSAPEVRPVRPVDTLAGLAEELARPMAEPAAPRTPPAPQSPRPAAPSAPAVPAASAAATTNVPLPGPGADASLAEMAQRLEAALRRPNAQKIVAEGQRVTATLDVKAAREPNGAPPAQQAQPSQPAPKGNPPPPAPKTPSMLEKEMASLLNNRNGKS
jgi:hypothetical protein